MQKYFKNGKITTTETYDEMLKPLNIALNACTQLIGDKFACEIWDKHYAKYPIGEDFLESIVKPMNEKERKDFIASTKSEEEKRQEVIHLLFDTMRDNYQQWWD